MALLLDPAADAMTGSTLMLVEIIGAERALIRGRCKRVQPEEWGVAEVPASAARKGHIAALAAGTTS